MITTTRKQRAGYLFLVDRELLLDALEVGDDGLLLLPSLHLSTDSQLGPRVVSDLDPVRRGVSQRRYRRQPQRIIPVAQVLAAFQIALC